MIFSHETSPLENRIFRTYKTPKYFRTSSVHSRIDSNISCSCCETRVVLATHRAPIRLPSRIQGAMHHPSTLSFELAAVVVCRENSFRSLVEVSTFRRQLQILNVYVSCVIATKPVGDMYSLCGECETCRKTPTLRKTPQVLTTTTPAGRPKLPGDRKSESTPPKKSR